MIVFVVETHTRHDGSDIVIATVDIDVAGKAVLDLEELVRTGPVSFDRVTVTACNPEPISSSIRDVERGGLVPYLGPATRTDR